MDVLIVAKNRGPVLAAIHDMVAGSIGLLRSAKVGVARQTPFNDSPLPADQFTCNFLQIKEFRELSLRQESLGKEDDNGLKPFVGALWVSNPTR